MEAKVKITLQSNNSAAQEITLNAVGFLDVSVGESQEVVASWHYSGQILRFVFQSPIPVGQQRTLTVSYRVVDPIDGLHFSVPDESYPKRPLAVVSDNETERCRYWLPCVDYPAVRTTVEYHLTSEASHYAVANGVLDSQRDNPDGTRTTVWKCSHRVPSYLLCLGVGEYTCVQGGEHAGVPIAFIGPRLPGAEECLKLSLGITPRIMEWMVNKLRVPFPFAKYYQLMATNITGAMENITLTTWDWNTFALDPVSATEYQDVMNEVNVHEMAHSYFGDSVVVRHFDHAWLKESWATYMQCMWYEDAAGGADPFQYRMHVCAEHYTAECEQYVRPIVIKEYNSSWMMYDRHLYPGGCWRLHMLRELLTPPVFWDAVREYLTTYAGKARHQTEDFRRVLERHSGLNLTRFFDQWIYGKGYPRLRATLLYNAASGKYSLAVEQTQRDEKKGIGVFACDLEVDVGYADAPEVRLVLQFDEFGKATAELPNKARPRWIAFDPCMKLLFVLEAFAPGEDILVNSIAHPSVRSRLIAVDLLAKAGTKTAIAQLLRAMKAEPFWGVRVQAAKSLSRLLTQYSLNALAELLLAEKDPRALHSIASVCGIPDRRLRSALLEVLQRPDLPYRARARALKSLGKQRDARDFELIRKHADDAGWQAIVRGGAVSALGFLRHPEAFRFLLSRLPYGAEDERCRVHVVNAIAQAAVDNGAEEKRQAVEALRTALRDPSWLVRRAAVSALGTLRAGVEVIAAVEAVKKTCAEQYHPTIDREVNKLHAPAPGDPESVAQLRRDLEAALKRLACLEEKLASGSK